MELINRIKQNARLQNKRIVLPEGIEPRTLSAADEIIADGIARIILLGAPSRVME
ncbi:MAG: phosphate acetyltransferase, partial [Bacteroidia bacterium]